MVSKKKNFYIYFINKQNCCFTWKKDQAIKEKDFNSDINNNTLKNSSSEKSNYIFKL